MAEVREGVYLISNAPERSQFRTSRREPIKSVIVMHTAESGTDVEGADPKAENVARFIRDRDDPGSYHLIGDSDSIIQLVPFEYEAWQDGSGSNPWAIGISLAMNAKDWAPGKLSEERYTALVDTAGQMAAMAANWLITQGLERPAGVRLTVAESDKDDASGFVAHGDRHSGRTDPGSYFPWGAFFTAYERALGTAPTSWVDPPSMTAEEQRPYIASIQQSYNVLQTSEGGNYRLAVDGVCGTKTDEAVVAEMLHVTMSVSERERLEHVRSWQLILVAAGLAFDRDTGLPVDEGAVAKYTNGLFDRQTLQDSLSMSKQSRENAQLIQDMASVNRRLRTMEAD